MPIKLHIYSGPKSSTDVLKKKYTKISHSKMGLGCFHKIMFNGIRLRSMTMLHCSDNASLVRMLFPRNFYYYKVFQLPIRYPPPPHPWRSYTEWGFQTILCWTCLMFPYIWLYFQTILTFTVQMSRGEIHQQR
jgi:hypothetical protein